MRGACTALSAEATIVALQVAFVQLGLDSQAVVPLQKHSTRGHWGALRELLARGIFKTPLNALRPSIQSLMLLKQIKKKLYTDRGCQQSLLLDPEEDMFARNFWQGLVWVPARVVGTIGFSFSQVCLEDGTLCICLTTTYSTFAQMQ